MMNPQGGSQLKELARESVLSLIRKLGATAECDLSNITEIVLVGNPIMHHSFLGFDVVPLGQMPFDLATDEAVQIPAEEVGIPIPAASV
ncbi:MAG TPA: drug:proton antiporter, partial [Acidimicrobiaceae bacterium]|nr:drug:proton antiporter [Acidimicrobiaceae bacterium]